MSARHPLLERLGRGPALLVDRSVWVELEALGYAPEGPSGSAAAAREAPELVSRAHRAALDAGAHVLTASTALCSTRALARSGFGMRAAAITHQAVDLAHEAAERHGGPVLIAGALGPLGAGPQSPVALRAEHSEQALRLEAAGVHAVLVEAMPTVMELVAATVAVSRAGLPAWVLVAQREDWPERVACAVAAGAQAVLFEAREGGLTFDALHEVAGVPVGLVASGPLGRWHLRAPEASAGVAGLRALAAQEAPPLAVVA